MANEITIKQLNVNSVLSSGTIDTKDIFIGGKSVKDIIDGEYTAFEVHPTDVEISAGTIDDVTGLEYKVAVPAQMTCKFTVRSDGPTAYAGFKTDWGDGTVSTIEDSVRSGDKATLSHTYSVPGRYIVKVYGQIYGFINEKISDYNLISRIWDGDLPIAHGCYCWKQICDGALRLQQVVIPKSFKWPSENLGLYQAFRNAKNLITFKCNAPTPFCHSMQDMFRGCAGMTSCVMEYENFGIWKSVDGRYSDMFNGCSSLATPVNRIIPMRGWCNTRIHIERFFNECTSLPADVGSASSGTDIASVLWKVDGIPYEFWGKTEMFKTCSEELRALVPVSFGGTKE